ncbi:MAG: aminotransferase class I/II-fold pyridoxal phosphate-dependent enzyme [Planctomycetota bacterium]
MSDQPRLFLSPPHMSGKEQEYIAEVFESNYIAPVGPHLTKFEEKFAEAVGVKHAAAVASGTAAIHLALRQLDLQPGDEVLCSSMTFCASANPILYEGAQPVFIDSDLVSWNLDPNLVEEEIKDCDQRGKLPKAIVAVDILGQSADMDAITSIADRYEIPVIEDAAEALGGTYKGRPAGNSGWCSTFSFNGNKIITTSGGGMLCSNDEAMIKQARYLATQARDPAPYYEHSTYGYNYRLSNVLAAIGLAQLEVLPQRVARRKEIFEHYQSELGKLPGISFMPIAEFGTPNYWLTSMLIDADKFGKDCETVRQHLESQNIEARRIWNPMHKQPVFANCRCRGGAVSEMLLERGLNLPSGSAMKTADLERVCRAFNELA